MADGYYNNNGNNYNRSYMDYLSFPIHLCFLMAIVVFILGLSWYMNYESMVEEVTSHLKLWLMLSPLLLLLAVHWLSTHQPERVPFFVPLPENKDSLHRAGGSPWGVALLLLFLFLMISNQSSFHDRWFPLRNR